MVQAMRLTLDIAMRLTLDVCNEVTVECLQQALIGKPEILKYNKLGRRRGSQTVCRSVIQPLRPNAL